MTTNYNVDWNKRGVNGFGSPFCDTIFTAALKAATETTLAVPLTAAMGAPSAPVKNKFLAIISFPPTAEIWISVNSTAAIPAGAGFAASTSEILNLNNSAKYCKAGDTLHFICTAGSDISVAFYAIQE